MNVLKMLIPWIIIVVAAVFLFSTDDSDVNWHDRSGLRLHIDNRTGCHYFSGLLGGPIERKDRNGKQICDPR